MLRELGVVLEVLMPAMNAQYVQELVTVLQHNAATDLFNLVLLGWATHSLFSCLQIVFMKMSIRGGRRNVFWSNFVSLVCFGVAMASSTSFLILSTNPSFLRGLSSGTLDYIPLAGDPLCGFGGLASAHHRQHHFRV